MIPILWSFSLNRHLLCSSSRDLNEDEKMRQDFGKRSISFEKQKISSKVGMIKSIFSFSTISKRRSINFFDSKRGLGTIKFFFTALEKRLIWKRVESAVNTVCPFSWKRRAKSRVGIHRPPVNNIRLLEMVTYHVISCLKLHYSERKIFHNP